MKMILCVGARGELGKDNKLLKHNPEDLAYFKSKTEGQVVVMGNTTFKSLPFKNGLPNRKNVVLSRKITKNRYGPNQKVISWCNSVDWFVEDALPFYEEECDKEVWVIGGASIYGQMITYCDEVHMTVMEDTFPDADTHINTGRLLQDFNLVEVKTLNDYSAVGIFKRIK